MRAWSSALSGERRSVGTEYGRAAVPLLRLERRVELVTLLAGGGDGGGPTDAAAAAAAAAAVRLVERGGAILLDVGAGQKVGQVSGGWGDSGPLLSLLASMTLPARSSCSSLLSGLLSESKVEREEGRKSTSAGSSVKSLG